MTPAQILPIRTLTAPAHRPFRREQPNPMAEVSGGDKIRVMLQTLLETNDDLTRSIALNRLDQAQASASLVYVTQYRPPTPQQGNNKPEILAALWEKASPAGRQDALFHAFAPRLRDTTTPDTLVRLATAEALVGVASRLENPETFRQLLLLTWEQHKDGHFRHQVKEAVTQRIRRLARSPRRFLQELQETLKLSGTLLTDSD